jgi:hypothetical protein
MVFTLSNGTPAVVANSKAQAVEAFNRYLAAMGEGINPYSFYTEADIITVDELSTRDYELGYDAFKAGLLFAVAC